MRCDIEGHRQAELYDVMAKRTLIITGSKELNRRLNALGGEKAKQFHRKAIREAARPVLQEAKATAPVKSGALRDSLTIRALKKSRTSSGVRVTQKSGFYKGKTFYGGFLEFGWMPGKRQRKSITRLSVSDRRKIPGRWFMRQAGETRRSEAIEIYERELDYLIRHG